MLGTQLASPLRPYVEDATREVFSGFADRQRAARDSAETECTTTQHTDQRKAPTGQRRDN